MRIVPPAGVPGVPPTPLPPAGNWIVRLANALAVRGYSTVDLRNIDRSPFVRLDAAIRTAQAQYGQITDPQWSLVTRHLVTAKVLGVATIALKSSGDRIRLVALRPSPDGSLDIAEAKAYHHAMSQWCDQLSCICRQRD